MAEFDLPAMIDYVLKETGQKKLFYIGHSQGTSAAFALLSESPEYNEKVRQLSILKYFILEDTNLIFQRNMLF